MNKKLVFLTVRGDVGLKWYEWLNIIISIIASITGILSAIIKKDNQLLFISINLLAVVLLLFITLKERDWNWLELQMKMRNKNDS